MILKLCINNIIQSEQKGEWIYNVKILEGQGMLISDRDFITPYY